MITFHFIRRGYPKSLLQKAFENVNGLKREEVLNKNLSEKEIEENTTFFFTTYNPGFDGMKTLVKKNWFFFN